MDTSQRQITQLLVRANEGDDSARDALLQVTYEELRRMARGYFAGERRDHTLQATALVHEVQLRLLGSEVLPGANRRQFFSFAAKAMRHLLVDHARACGRQKRGGGGRKLPLDEGLVVGSEPNIDHLALDEALERLAAMDERKARIVELKYFAGLTGDQIAEIIEISPATVDRDWEVARTWLFSQLSTRDD